MQGPGLKITLKCTDPENETAVKLIQRGALTSLHGFINILMEENISLSPTVFLCFEFMTLHTFKLLLHNRTIGQRNCKEEEVQLIFKKIRIYKLIAERERGSTPSTVNFTIRSSFTKCRRRGTHSEPRRAFSAD